MKYEVQVPKDLQSGYRIADIETDSRVATCFDRRNAEMVCDALNGNTAAAQSFPHMSANDYQRNALRTERTPGFIETDDPAERQVLLARVIHGAIGICTETGELQDMIKKHLIYGKDFDPVNVIEECGDILWYIALTLDATGYTMAECMQRNIDKLRVRFPEKFTSEKALTRDLDAERAALEQKP